MHQAVDLVLSAVAIASSSPSPSSPLPTPGLKNAARAKKRGEEDDFQGETEGPTTTSNVSSDGGGDSGLGSSWGSFSSVVGPDEATRNPLQEEGEEDDDDETVRRGIWFPPPFVPPSPPPAPPSEARGTPFLGADLAAAPPRPAPAYSYFDDDGLAVHGGAATASARRGGSARSQHRGRSGGEDGGRGSQGGGGGVGGGDGERRLLQQQQAGGGGDRRAGAGAGDGHGSRDSDCVNGIDLGCRADASRGSASVGGGGVVSGNVCRGMSDRVSGSGDGSVGGNITYGVGDNVSRGADASDSVGGGAVGSGNGSDRGATARRRRRQQQHPQQRHQHQQRQRRVGHESSDGEGGGEFVMLVSREATVRELAARVGGFPQEWLEEAFGAVVRRQVERAVYDARARAAVKRAVRLLDGRVSWKQVGIFWTFFAVFHFPGLLVRRREMREGGTEDLGRGERGSREGGGRRRVIDGREQGRRTGGGRGREAFLSCLILFSSPERTLVNGEERGGPKGREGFLEAGGRLFVLASSFWRRRLQRVCTAGCILWVYPGTYPSTTQTNGLGYLDTLVHPRYPSFFLFFLSSIGWGKIKL